VLAVPALTALAAPGCRGFCAREAGADRPKTTASISLITFRCMIWFFSMETCPTPGTSCTLIFSSLPWNCPVFATGVPAPLAM
jgi:hypothetical protein